MIGQLLGFTVGVALFFLAVMAFEYVIWRLRGRPLCGFKPPLHWRNLLDDGWTSYRMKNGAKGWSYTKPKWQREQDDA